MSYRGLGVGGELHCSLSSQGLFNINTQRLGFALASTPGVAQKSNDAKTGHRHRPGFGNAIHFEHQHAFDLYELADAAEVVGDDKAPLGVDGQGYKITAVPATDIATGRCSVRGGRSLSHCQKFQLSVT